MLVGVSVYTSRDCLCGISYLLGPGHHVELNYFMRWGWNPLMLVLFMSFS